MGLRVGTRLATGVSVRFGRGIILGVGLGLERLCDIMASNHIGGIVMTEREEDEIYLKALGCWERGETQRSIVARMPFVMAWRLKALVKAVRDCA